MPNSIFEGESPPSGRTSTTNRRQPPVGEHQIGEAKQKSCPYRATSFSHHRHRGVDSIEVANILTQGDLNRARVWQNDYADHAEARRDIADYIAGFNNNGRLHSTLGYLPPTDYERKTSVQHPVAVSENT